MARKSKVGSEDEGFFSVPLEEESKKPSPSKKTVGKVYAIRNGMILVDVDGNGASLKYDEKLHSNLEIGDQIEL